MSQNSLVLPTTGTVSGLQMTQNTNNALDTLNTLASGATAPASPESGQFWHDTTNNVLNLRSLDNTAWIALVALNESSYLSSPAYASQVTGSVNRILNGEMAIDQVNEGGAYTLATGTPIYTLDQWIASLTSGSASGVTAQRVADAPAGFLNSLKVTVGTGAGSVASGDFLYINQPIEGINVEDLAYGTSSAASISLSFWVKSSVSGTFSISLSNSAAGRSLVSTFSIPSTGVWTKITIPNIPGDVAGTWGTGSGIGLNVAITIAAGSSSQTSTLNSWQAAFLLASTLQTNNVLTTSGATFQVTGVMLNPGAFCLPFGRRLVQYEMQALERYYFKTFPMGTAVAQNAGNTGAYSCPQPAGASVSNAALAKIPFRVRMRTAPSITLYNPGNTNAQIRNPVVGTDWSSSIAALTDESGAGLIGTTPGGSSAGQNGLIHVTASARM